MHLLLQFFVFTRKTIKQVSSLNEPVVETLLIYKYDALIQNAYTYLCS